jgi:hypothetical protein
LITYHGYDEPLSNTTSDIDRLSSPVASSTIARSTVNETDYILVSRISGIGSKFISGNYLEISTHDLAYYKRYEITRTDVVFDRGSS